MKGVNWLELPDHIVSIIANKLVFIKDYIRFGVVCHSWYTVCIENRHLLPRQPPTLLMLVEYYPRPHNKLTRTLYNATEERALSFQAPVPHDRFVCGSSHGWLVTSVRVSYEVSLVSLVNPLVLVNNEIQLPPLTDGGILQKVVLSANPVSNPNNYVTMAICGFGQELAFLKPGDKGWTSIMRPYLCDFMADVIYHKDQFYIVDFNGRVFSCDLNCPKPGLSIVTDAVIPISGYRRYLVELSGDLLQVCAHPDLVDDDDDDDSYKYFTARFDAFKLDSVGLNWITTNNLHGHALFLGDNHSMSLLVSEFPECKPNTIYYIDDYDEGSNERCCRDGEGFRSIRIYNFDDHTIELIMHDELMISTPIWIEPTL